MDFDRRESLRISNRLPLAWQTFSHTPDTATLHRAFGRADWPHQRLDDLAESIRLTMPMLASETRDVVRLLEEKLDVIATHLAFPAPTRSYDLNLSHDGLDFAAKDTQDLTTGTNLGIHLALGTGNLICPAKVVHCGEWASWRAIRLRYRTSKICQPLSAYAATPETAVA